MSDASQLAAPAARALVAAATPVAAVATLAAVTGSELGVAVAFVGWLVVAAGLAAAPLLWPETRPRWARLGFSGALALALLALLGGLFGSWAIAVDHSLCGGEGAALTAFAMAGAGYALAATFALATMRRALWAWPLLVLVALGLRIALLFVLPGARGYCET